jgi:hypothetical protein
MKRAIFTLLFVFVFGSAYTQYMRGFINSNYAGIQGVFFNPANLADSRSRLEFDVLSGYLDANNNHINVKTPYSQWKALKGKLPSKYIDNNGFPVFKSEYAVEKLNGKKKNFYASGEITGPSFMFNLNNKSGFAFANRTRFFVHAAGLNEDLLKIFLEDMDTTKAGYSSSQNQLRYIGKRNTQNNFGFGAAAFEEFGFSYAQVLMDNKEHFLKGGVTLKYLIGMGAAHIQVNEIDYELLAVDSIRFYSTDLSLAYVSEQYFENEQLRLNDILGKNKLANGLGLDIGVVYEFRPNYKDYKYRMDRKTHEDRGANKYKMKIGASLNDFGSVTYDNSEYLTKIDVSSSEPISWSNFNSFKTLGSSSDADSFVYELWANSDSVNVYKSKLPTSLNLNFDYHIDKNFYVGGSYVQSLRGKNVAGVKKQNVLALNARYERKWYGASFSLIGGNFYHRIHTGMMIRLGPVYIGSDHLGSIFTAKRTEGVNLYAGVKLPIHYNRIKDSDMDGVSDDRDKCPDLVGSASAYGCPDADGDRVPDKDDLCPNLAGKRNTKGCPDEDGDKVVGNADKCPDKAGTKDSEGCPDSDGDGLADHIDRCPDEKGSKELHGCPIERASVGTDTVKVIQKKVPQKDSLGLITDYDHIINKMDFENFNYYIILGAYGNKDYASHLVESLNTKAGVSTFIFREVEGTTFYVTFGKASSKEEAQKQVLLLNKPEVQALINGHIWWKKIPK